MMVPVALKDYTQRERTSLGVREGGRGLQGGGGGCDLAILERSAKGWGCVCGGSAGGGGEVVEQEGGARTRISSPSQLTGA